MEQGRKAMKNEGGGADRLFHIERTSASRPGVDYRPSAEYDLSHREREAALTILTVLITVAILATILTLVMGLWTMVYGADDGPFDSEHWMTYRVILQVVTVLALGATFFVSS